MHTTTTGAERTARVIQRCLNVLLQWRQWLDPVRNSVAFGDLQDAATALRLRGAALATARLALTTNYETVQLLREDLRLNAIRPAVVIAQRRLSNIRELQSFRVPDQGAASSEYMLIAHALAGAINRNADAFAREGLPATAAVHMASLARSLDTALELTAEHRKMCALQQEGITRALGYGSDAIAILDAALGYEFKRAPLMARQWRIARGLKPKVSAARAVAVGE